MTDTGGFGATFRKLGIFLAVAATTAALSVTSAPLAGAIPAALTKPTLRIVTFSSPASVASWTAPGDASATVDLMISALGGQGGRGGYDGGTTPAPGGYVGVVSGTLSVAAGTALQIAVGAGGAAGPNSVSGGAGGNGGANKFGGFAGGKGGTTGKNGTSGAGGGGGGATVIKVAGATIVAGGAGGGGGSGNGGVLTGRAAEAAYSPEHSTGGTTGGAGDSVPTSGSQLDGGGAGGGGGGATGGEGGHIEYGSGATMEWFGYGGYPGANATGGFGTLDGAYQYFSGNGADGSVTIRYVDGPPAGAQNVIGRPGAAEGSVELSWQTPVSSGLSSVTAYQVQYSDDGGSTWSDATLSAAPTVTTGGGAAMATGLSAGTDYTFRVAAQNSYGHGGWSVPSATVTAASAGGSLPASPWNLGTSGGTGAEHAHVVPGDGTVTVTWDGNGSGGSTAPTDYLVHVYDSNGHEAGNSPQMCAAADCAVSGLDPAQHYTTVIETPGTPTSPAVTVTAYDEGGNNAYAAPDGWDGTPGQDATIVRNADGTVTVSPSPMPSEPYLLHIADEDGEIGDSPFPCAAGAACTSGYLDPATAYDVTLELPNRTAPSPAIQPEDGGAWTSPQDPARVPTPAPTSLASTSRDRALAISFAAPVPQPAGNEILYYQSSLDGGSTWANSGAFASPANVSGLTNGTQYTVMLRAMTLEGPGLASGAVTGTPRSYPSAPYAGGNPANLRVTGVSGSNYTVAWDPYLANGAAISSYTVTAFNAASAGSAVKTCSAPGTGTSCTLSGLSGVVYLSVQAQNSIGASPRSDPRLALDTAATAPGAPGKPAVSGGMLTWTAPTGTVDAYVITFSADGGTSWSTVTPASGPSTSGGTVTAGIASLPGDASYLFRVQGLNGALSGPWSPPSDATGVAAPAVPQFGVVTRTPGGYRVPVTNFDPGLGWSAVASAGAASIDASGVVTVGGLTASQSATVTVTATAFGTGSRSTSTGGTALGGTAPILSAATPISGGFTVQIVNWSVYKNGRYGPHTVYTPVLVANPNGVTPVYSGPDGAGLITVTGIGDAHRITLAYRVASDTHTETQGDGVVGKSLLAPVNPTFGTATPTRDGYIVKVTNFDNTGETSYTVTVDHGTVAGPDADGIITVSALAAGTSATVNVVAQQDGHAIGQSSRSGTALAAGAAPVFGPVARGSGGFTTSVTIPGGYSGATLSVMVSGGATVQCGLGAGAGAAKANGPVSCANGDTITVSGVASGAAATVTAYLWDSSHGVAAADVTGHALYAGVAPEFGNYTRTDNGFTIDIVNWSAFAGDGSGTAYDSGKTVVTVAVAGVGASNPSVVCDGAVTCSTAGHIVVTGLTSTESTAQQAEVTVSVAETGGNHAPSSAMSLGEANKLLEHFSHYARASDGFTVTIKDYSSTDYAYTVALSGAEPAGATVKCGGAGVGTSDGPVVCANENIIVTGLDAGAGATVEVVATGQGDPAPGNWTSSFEGAALAAGASFDFEPVTRTSGGFETAITAGTFDTSGATTYAVTVTAADGSTVIPGAQVARMGRFITVSGLDTGVQARVTVVATKQGATAVTNHVDGMSKEDGIKPNLVMGSRAATGFNATISNQTDFGSYDSATTLVTVMVSGGATVQCAAGGAEKGPRVNGPVTCALSEVISVSGVASGGVATVTAAVIDKDHVDVVSDGLTGQAKFAGVAPEFGEVERTADGFTVTIANYDQFKGAAANGSAAANPRTSAYVVANTTVSASVAGIGGSSPVVSGPDSAGTLTVTGLASEQQAKVTVSVTESDGNHTDSAAVRQGQALATGVIPTFDQANSLVTSFGVRIANYDAASSYTLTATAGSGGGGPAIPAKNISFNAGTRVVTVTGLADGAQATLHVHVAAAGKLPADGFYTGTALKTPVTPVLAVAANNATGFVVRIVNLAAFDAGNYGAGTTFVPSATAQSGDPAPTVTDNHDGTFTVTGVPTGHTATLAVTVKQAEHPDAVSDPVTGTALYAGVAPTFGSPTRTADGFRVPITNYALYTVGGTATVLGDDGSKYGAAGQFSIVVTAVSTGGTALGDVKAAVVPADGVLQVSGLFYGQSASVTLTAGDGLTRHQDATSATVSGVALLAPIPASFGELTATIDSVTVRIANFDADANYAISTTAGSVSRSGSAITVTGLDPGEDATITVAATTPGHVQGVSSISGTALKVQDQPGSSSTVQREGGFSAKITPFDKGASYSAVVSGAPGAGVKVTGDTVTVTGMRPGDTVTVTVTQTKKGYAPVTMTFTYTLPADAGTDKDPSGGVTPPPVAELKPGEASVTVNGVAVPSRTSVGPNGVTVTWQDMSMTAVQMADGKPVAPGADKLLTVPFTGSVKVDVSGFAPGSRVQLWAFSAPTLLGTFTSRPDARGIITVVLPGAVIVGDHTLVAAGLNRAGENVTLSTAMRVTPLAAGTGVADPEATDGREEIAYTGTHTLDQLRIAAGLLVVGLGLVALSYRRRRPDPALAQVGVAGGFGPEPEAAGAIVVATGTWRRPPDSGAVAAAITASEATAVSGSAHLRPALADDLDPDVPATRADSAVGTPADMVAASGVGRIGHRFIEPRVAPSVEWLSLRFSLGLTER